MPDDPQLDALKLPPHSLEAEQSILGGLLLDNEAADRIGDVVAEDDFYSDAHRLIYRHVMPARRRGQAGRRRHAVGGAGVGAEARLRRRPRLPGRARAERADRGEHPALREDRARALDPAPARGDGGRDRRFRVQPARPQARRPCSTRPRPRCCTSRSRARAAQRTFQRSRHAAGRRRRPHRDALQPRRSVRRHRRGHRLHRSRPDDVRACSRATSSIVAGRPSMGKTVAGAQHRRARRARPQAAGRRVLDGNGRVAARDADDRLGRQARPAQAAHRPPRAGRLGEAVERARTPERSADADRRDAGAQRHRGALARAAAAEAIRPARPRDRRLPPADAGVDRRARTARRKSPRSRAR